MNKTLRFGVTTLSMALLAAGCTPGTSAPAANNTTPTIETPAAEEIVALKFGDIQAGYRDTIKYSKNEDNRIWVEMKDKEPSESGSRKVSLEYTISREITAVEADGSILAKLTIDKVALSIKNLSDSTDKHNYYISEPGSTKTSWPGEPTLAGKTLNVKIYPDSTVEFIDLAELRKAMKFSDRDNSTAAVLLSEKNLRGVLERTILTSCPNDNIAAKTWDKFVQIPDPMLNAKALRLIYTNSGKNDSGDLVLKTDIEPLYVLPEGVQDVPTGDPFRLVVKTSSDLQEPMVESETIIDQKTGLITRDKLNVTYLMIIDGNKLFPDQKQKNPEADAGMMFTEIKSNELFEIVK